MKFLGWMGALLFFIPINGSFATATYSVIPVVLAADADPEALDMNASCQIVGDMQFADENRPSCGFLWEHGVTTLLGDYTTADTINDFGVIAGEAAVDSESDYFTYLYQGGRRTSLGISMRPQAINNAGLIAGEIQDDPYDHAAFYANGARHDIGTLGGRYSILSAMNDSGQMVGYSTVNSTSSTLNRPFIFQNGTMTEVPNNQDASFFALAFAINASGQVVGAYELDPPSDHTRSHACRYVKGKIVDLGALGGSISSAADINASGEIVGHSYTKNNSAIHGFLSNGGKMVDLNSMIDHTRANWQIGPALRITDTGIILCEAISRAGGGYALLAPAASVTLSGGKNRSTHGGKLVLRGKSRGTTQIAYRVNGRGGFKPASGISRWRLVASLKIGVNHITLLPRGPMHNGRPVTITVTRS